MLSEYQPVLYIGNIQQLGVRGTQTVSEQLVTFVFLKRLVFLISELRTLAD